MWISILTAAITAGEWLVDRQRQQREKVPERLLTSGYFEAMADDIESRLDEGLNLREALEQVHAEQGPVLLRPAPKPRSRAGWMIPVMAGGILALGVAAFRRRG
ncbi:MAG: hypothetical protein WD733_19700 [Bryobacterales bacterium]